MNVELGCLGDGGMVIMADTAFPHDISRIEYYREVRLLLLVYDDADHEGDLMHYELGDGVDHVIRRCNTILVVDHGADRKLYGYDVPLVVIGS